jgi:4-amino-4-deoxy-L-arabinose transferase-like glycosyltransferase
VPAHGPAALLVCLIFALPACLIIHRVDSENGFLLRVFIIALLIRVLLGTLIFSLDLHEFFGPDAYSYDQYASQLLKYWQGQAFHNSIDIRGGGAGNWGMYYLIAAVYAVIGRNMLATQYINAVVGAATAPVIFLCAKHIFDNRRVSRIATLCVAFFPSLVLWSSIGLKDALVVFTLSVTMLATLNLSDKFNFKYLVILICALFCLFVLRFYIFYMVITAIGGTFVIGLRTLTIQSFLRQLAIIVLIGLSLTYLGVLRAASTQVEVFGDLQAVQNSRLDQAQTGQSGFARDADVSTVSGVLTTIPLGLVYLLFAPFPWQIDNLRQGITLPEMIVWWCSFPLLAIGLFFTIRYRLRRALPILLFTIMLTFAYSIVQGNVGTAYRVRAQLLVFYFIQIAVGFVVLRERSENKRQQLAVAKGWTRVKAADD